MKPKTLKGSCLEVFFLQLLSVLRKLEILNRHLWEIGTDDFFRFKSFINITIIENILSWCKPKESFTIILQLTKKRKCLFIVNKQRVKKHEMISLFSIYIRKEYFKKINKNIFQYLCSCLHENKYRHDLNIKGKNTIFFLE
jgi:hypothetical protein